jgi:hypothetical protein
MKVKGSGLDFRWGYLICSIYIILSAASSRRVYSAYNKWVPEDISGGRARPARKVDKLAALYKPIVWTMWDPRHLASLYASRACYEDSCTYFIIFLLYISSSLS